MSGKGVLKAKIYHLCTGINPLILMDWNVLSFLVDVPVVTTTETITSILPAVKTSSPYTNKAKINHVKQDSGKAIVQTTQGKEIDFHVLK